MLNEQLQKQIEQEAEHYANVHIGEKAKFIGHHDSRRWDDAKEDWEAGATQYADLWQAAEEKVQRYEKALKEIKKGLNWIENSRELDIIHDALTPKTSTDE